MARMTLDHSLVTWLGSNLDVTTLACLRKLEQSEFFTSLLLDCAGGTHLPEVCAVLGPDAVLKFFDHFAGTTIEVPNRTKIERAMRNTTIFFKLHNTKTGHKREVARQLGIEFDLDTSSVYKIYLDYRKRFEELRETREKMACLKPNTTSP